MIEQPPPLWLPPKPAIIRTVPDIQKASFLPGMFPAAVGSAAPIEPASLTFIEARSGGTNQTTYTLTGFSFGDVVASPNKRVMYVWIGYASASNISVNITAATIGGRPCTELYSAQVVAATSLRRRYVVLAAEVPTGTSGTVEFTDNVSNVPIVMLFRGINLASAAIDDSDQNAGTGAAAITLDCPAGGGVMAIGSYGYSSPNAAASLTFNNLSLVYGTPAQVGDAAGVGIFPTAQTGLDCTFDPAPNTGISRTEAFAISLANPFV